MHEHRRPPCEACREAGQAIAAECSFPQRGERDLDREFRRRPPKDRALSSPEASGPRPATEDYHGWPSHFDVVEGCKVFVTSYFQLGFIPKAVFIEGLVKDQDLKRHSKFLLTCILSISARFTPPLVKRYGSGQHATKYFTNLASQMVPSEMYEPSLERTQGFFLLAIAEWGNGDKNRSSMHMGLAVRMASILKLHREETYQLDLNGPADDAVRSESARRTFWMIQSQENLHSGFSTPAPFPLEDVTALLPSSESDFAFGIVPSCRASLPGTRSALLNPNSVFAAERSLFASLIQAHSLWGRIARRAHKPEQTNAESALPPWNNQSDFKMLTSALDEWESKLPPRHRWSVWNLRGWKAESLDLAYLAVVMVLRMSNIVARRIYLDDIIAALAREEPAVDGSAPQGFWLSLSHQLFANVLELYEQIDAYFAMRAKEEGAAILVFCVYICGSLSSYLRTYPQLCTHLAGEAGQMAVRCLEILSELQHAWPTAMRWQQGLRQVATPQTSNGAVVSPVSIIDAHTPFTTLDDDDHSGAASRPGSLVRASNEPVAPGDVFMSDPFNADLNSFLQGDLPFGLFDGWNVLPVEIT